MTIPRPILSKHLAAGQMAFDSLSSWHSTIKALDVLAERFPNHGRAACLLKVSSLNALMGANVPSVWDMAEHVRQVMAGPPMDGPPLVERLSQLGRKSYRSFASKYAHFFIDPKLYPIYDVHARTLMADHLGDRRVDLDSYAEFFERFKRLQESYEHEVSLRALDRYLWIAGKYRRWCADRTGWLEQDFRAYFEDLEADESAILGYAPRIAQFPDFSPAVELGRPEPD